MKNLLFRHLALQAASRLMNVEPEGTGEPGGGGGEGGEQPEATTVPIEQFRELQSQLAAANSEKKTEREQRVEAQQTAQFWAERAKTGQSTETKAEVAAAEVDLVEAITNGDKAGVAAALRGMGFMTKAEATAEAKRIVDERVDTERGTANTNAQLYKDYETLRDENSPHFKLTAELFAGYSKKVSEAEALEMAADGAAARLGIKRGAAAGETEEERAVRISSQSGPSGNRQTTPTKKELSAEERDICSKLGVSPEAYLKRKKEGEY